MAEKRGDLGSAGDDGESVYGENAEVKPAPGEWKSGDSKAIILVLL